MCDRRTNRHVRAITGIPQCAGVGSGRAVNLVTHATLVTLSLWMWFIIRGLVLAIINHYRLRLIKLEDFTCNRLTVLKKSKIQSLQI